MWSWTHRPLPADRGVEACGIDLSPEMVAAACRLNPAIPFSVGTMLALDLDDGSLAGIVAFTHSFTCGVTRWRSHWRSSVGC
jgi:hypothetical protein